MNKEPVVSGMRPSTDVVTRQLGEGTVLVHLKTNRIYELNRTGARAWELAAQGQDVQQIVLTLAREFTVDVDHAHSEVSEFFALLGREGLVE